MCWMNLLRRQGWAVVLLVAGTGHAKELPGMAESVADEGIRSVAVPGGLMVRYEVTLPGTDVSFEMVPVPGGEFLLGSPPTEADRREDEGPQVSVQVAPFWMGRCEVTWAEYRAFMTQYELFKKLEGLRLTRSRLETARQELESLPAVEAYLNQQQPEVDAVTCPTPLYDTSYTYGPGEEDDQPAVTMTQFAAKQYTKWLSGITGQQFRLPTEAEWEYAARAGSTTAYAFGDDPAELEDHGWYEDNSDFETHAVGSKTPNAWGLFDLHGNAAEWVLDAFEPEHYGSLPAGITAWEAVAWPTRLFPRVIRGGSWLSPPAECRSAVRQGSDDEEWDLSDPNLPKSPWWFTEEQGMGVGFRIVRPLRPMDEAQQRQVWDADIKRLREDVAARIEEGRGAQSAADERLPAAIGELEAAQSAP